MIIGSLAILVQSWLCRMTIGAAEEASSGGSVLLHIWIRFKQNKGEPGFSSVLLGHPVSSNTAE